MFSAYTQALRDRDLPEEDIWLLNKIIPNLLFDLRSAGEAFEDMEQTGLSGASPLGEVKTKAPNSDYHDHRDVPPASARQAKVARDYLKREERTNELASVTSLHTTWRGPMSRTTTTMPSAPWACTGSSAFRSLREGERERDYSGNSTATHQPLTPLVYLRPPQWGEVDWSKVLLFKFLLDSGLPLRRALV